MAKIAPAIGIVKMIDKATAPLRSIGRSFKKLGSEASESKAKISGFQNRLDATSVKLNRLNRSFKSGKKFLSGYAAGLTKIGTLGGVVSGAGIVAALNSQANSLDNLAKKSKNLALPIAELQAMRHQAGLAGVSAQEMDSNLTRFTKRLGVFQTTGGGLLATLAKKIPGGFKQALQGAKTNTEAYEILLKTFKKLPTQQAKMALADAAFGMSGRKSLILLEEGLDGLIRSRKELSDLGAIVTVEDTNAAEAYNDTFQRLKAGFDGMKIKVLTPVIASLTETLKQFVINFKNVDFREKVILRAKNAVFAMLNGFKALAKGVLFLSEHWKTAIAGVVAFKFAVMGLNAVMLKSPFGMAISAVGLLATGVYLLKENWDSLSASFKGMSAVAQAAVSVIAGVAGGLVVAKGAMIAFNLVAAANPLGVLISGVALLGTGLVLLVNNWDKVTSAIKRAWEWVKKIGLDFITGQIQALKQVGSFLGLTGGKAEVVARTEPSKQSILPPNQAQQSISQEIKQVQQRAINNNTNNNLNNINVNVQNDRLASVQTDGNATNIVKFNTGLQQ